MALKFTSQNMSVINNIFVNWVTMHMVCLSNFSDIIKNNLFYTYGGSTSAPYVTYNGQLNVSEINAMGTNFSGNI